MKSVSDTSCRENQNMYFEVNFFFFSKIIPFMIQWKNIVEKGRPQITIWRMRIACWITTATNTHNMQYLLVFHGNIGCTNALHCYIIHTFPVLESWFSLQPGHYSSLTAPNLQPTANQDRNHQCGNQRYSRELLMMGIVVPETCWAYKKYNKIISGI